MGSVIVNAPLFFRIMLALSRLFKMVVTLTLESPVRCARSSWVIPFRIVVPSAPCSPTSVARLVSIWAILRWASRKARSSTWKAKDLNFRMILLMIRKATFGWASITDSTAAKGRATDF